MQFDPLSKYKIDITQYKKEKQICVGGFGVVHLVSKIRTNNKYAAKIINCSSQKECQQVIDNEIKMMCTNKHPTIINIIGYSETDFQGDHNATIIMEYAKNGTLYNLLENSRKALANPSFSDTTRQIILIGIAKGMEYLHDKNIYHCDLKSTNILLNDDFHPLITDFGLARNIGYDKSYSIIDGPVGTLPYLAPEFLKSSEISRKTDVYAFGILMFEVVTNQEPYENLDKIPKFEFASDIIYNNRRPVFQDPGQIKPSIKSLIEQCWSHNKDKRPNFKDIFDKLSGNLNDDVNDENDNYFLSNVDVKEVRCYVEDISVDDTIEDLLQKVEGLKKGNEKLKIDNKEKSNQIKILNNENQANIIKIQNQAKIIEESNKSINKLQSTNDLLVKKQTFSSFNLLPLNIQYDISTQIKSSQFLRKVSDLISYILHKDPTESSNFISIGNSSTYNNDQLLSENGENMPINILWNSTEILHRHELLKSNDFINLLKKFETFSIEIKHPSNSFSEIYNSILEIKESNFYDQNQFKIAILISSIKEDDYHFTNDKNVNILRFSNSVSILKSDTDTGLFEGCTSLTEISIPSSISHIGKSSFKGSSSLTQISIPSSVKKIESFAFANCPQLSLVKLPNKIEEIGDSVFDGSLAISFSSEMLSIPDYCLSKSESIREVFIPFSVREIGAHAFEDCKSIKHIFIPTSVRSIGFYAFDGCSSLEEVYFPDSIIKIGNFTLNGCSSLKKCRLPSNTEEIGTCFFCGCSSLDEIDIPKNVKSIGNFAFNGCSSLEELEIPDSVENIGNLAFGDCSALKIVSISSSIKEIDFEIFECCSSLSEIKISRNTEVDESCFPSNVRISYL